MQQSFSSTQLYALSAIALGAAVRQGNGQLIGNALDFPRLQTWFKFTEWRDEYGDVVYAEALGKPMVILNTLEATNDLLEKRASNFTNRPNLVVVGEMMRVNEGMPMLPYGPAWKKQRRLANLALSIAA
ncbi:hypothetical protein MPER_01936, partial [Moniliophthora perniciosa FA553]